jgi:hypothetical protein
MWQDKARPEAQTGVEKDGRNYRLTDVERHAAKAILA